MTPQEIIDKWAAGGPAYALSERAGAQPHFMDLCSMLGVSTPGDAENFDGGTDGSGADPFAHRRHHLGRGVADLGA